MNPQTANWLEAARLYAKEFAKGLAPVISLTVDDIDRIAMEQAELSVEQAEYQNVTISEADYGSIQVGFYNEIMKYRDTVRLAAAKPTTRTSGPNIWATRWGFDIAEGVQLPDDTVICEWRPSDAHFPCVGYYRVNGSKYTPYEKGSKEWREAANAALAAEARANFERGK